MSEEIRNEHEHQQSVQAANGGAATDGPAVILTPRALEMVKQMHAKEGLGPDQGLRISVVGGGCSGFQYSLSFDGYKEGDIVREIDGTKVFVDEISLPYIAGVTLDYVESLHAGGFRFDTPRASRTCGCGSSFSA